MLIDWEAHGGNVDRYFTLKLNGSPTKLTPYSYSPYNKKEDIWQLTSNDMFLQYFTVQHHKSFDEYHKDLLEQAERFLIENHPEIFKVCPENIISRLQLVE